MADRDKDFVEVYKGGGYDSAFETDDEDKELKRKKRKDLAEKPKVKEKKKCSKDAFEEEFRREEGRKQRYHLLALDAYSRHKKFINDYILYYAGALAHLKRDTSRDRNDFDIIQENHRFIWNEEEDDIDSWEKRLAKKYYDKLYKEYCIADLSLYKINKIALRWQTEKEVIVGKGQFICGNKECNEKQNLRSWEVNFGYVEHGEKKNALIKLRLCSECSKKLNYHHKRKEVKHKKIRVEDEPKNKRLRPEVIEQAESDESSDSKTDTKEDSEKIEKESEIWSSSAGPVEEKSKDDEFEEYFEDMFL